jgi:sulfur-carrier protein
MPVLVAIPGALQPFAGGRSELPLDAPCATVLEALLQLAEHHPGVIDRVLDERGELRRHVNVFVDGEDVRFLAGLGTPLGERSDLAIVPSVSGG